MKKQFVIKLIDPHPIEISISNYNYNNDIIDIRNLELLTQYKNKIDLDKENKKWDYCKKLSNKYELIRCCSKTYNNISLYNPVSRSYYKLWEILYSIKNELNIDGNIKVCNIAEGPGGFMECIINFRKKYYNTNDSYYGITLQSANNNEIPKWKKLNIFKDCNISYGEDGTGNIYNDKNIKHFVKEVGPGTAELVTADGGFDFSTNFNKQEQMVYKLILCEIVTALGVQKKGGTFICKFFDLYSLPTIKLVYFLACHYEYVYIMKPSMSRPANSEKYVVCMNFKGINSLYYNKLLDIIRHLHIIDLYSMDGNNVFTDIFSSIDQSFVELIKDYNNYISKKQIKSFLQTFQIISNNYNYHMIKETQIYHAINWCLEYNVEINQLCNLFKKYKININCIT